MHTTYAALTDGTRLDITVEFITRRAVATDNGHVHRLLVADQAGTQFPILTTPDSDAFLDLKTGAEYEITGLLGVQPLEPPTLSIGTCPNCNGLLRHGQSIDVELPGIDEATAHLSIDETVGILDSNASIHRANADTDRIDDWTPMNTGTSRMPPEYVCTDCGRHVDSAELAGDGPADHAIAHQQPANASPAAPADETIGLATGGAKDAANFRENIANEYTPQPEAIPDEGLFYDYHFDVGDGNDPSTLFAPRYAPAVTTHPLTGDTEHYLSVGLDSTLSVETFERPRLDLVAVLDVSGSMNSPFDAYYYDEHGNRHEAEHDAATKLEAATQSLCALTEQLHESDQLGVVLYNHRAHVAKPLRDVGTTDMPAIRRHIKEIAAGGSTNLTDGFEAAVDMLDDGVADPNVERRVFFMTDMMPNTGPTSNEELTDLFADAAVDGIHTTFIGMGLDANAALVDTLSGIRGANHYFIHSPSEFERRLGDEFDYMVSPLVYDLNLELDADGYEIAAVHGSPAADTGTGQLMHVGTLFPSPTQDGDARGGVVLVELDQTTTDAEVELLASWTERGGGEHTERVTVELPTEPETYAHAGVRKAVGLTRYARELRSWAADVHDRADRETGVDDWLLSDHRGEHERESVPLIVPDEYTTRFDQLHSYLADEMNAVADETLQQELDLLETLCQQAPTPRTEVPE